MSEEYTYNDVLDANHYKAERDAALEKIKRIQEAIDESIEDNQNALLLLERDDLIEKLARAEKKVSELLDWIVKHSGREKRLGKEIDRLNRLLGRRKREISELSARAMPEGYRWPKFEDGKELEYGDRYIGNDGKEHKVWHIAFDSYRDVMILRCESFELQKEVYDDFENGERIKRPPVLADDGEPIEPGQVVVCGIESHVVDHIEYESGGAPNVYYEDGGWDYPDVISHSPAVLAADGKPIEVGQTVYFTYDGYEVEVAEIDYAPGTICNVMVRKEHTTGAWCEANKLTHQRPVLDADGKLIKVGDTVYGTVEGGPFTVTEVSEKGSVFVDAFPDTGMHGSMFTHTKPEPPDTWEQIDKDATELADRITTELQGHDYVTTRHYLRYLVRRCKKLAGVSV